MPRINQYTDNTTIENDDKLLTYDTQGAATKLTAFSTIWTWIVSKLHALTSSSAALTPSTDRVLMDKNGTMTRVEPAAVAKYGIETYNGSTIAGSAQTVKSALDTLNSKTKIDEIGLVDNLDLTISNYGVGSIKHFLFNQNATGNPWTTAGGHGFLFVNGDTNNYGCMIVLGNKGISARTINGGTYSTWNTIVS